MKFGEPVPEIDAPTTHGTRFQLSAQRGKYVVLYFYPRAFTPGCTMETKQFRDHYDELSALGAEVVGISTDDHTVQCDFAAQTQAKFPLIADPKAVIVSAFGAKWPLLSLAQRVTVVVDPEGKLAGYFHHELLVSKHVNDVVTLLKGRLKKAGAASTKS